MLNTTFNSGNDMVYTRDRLDCSIDVDSSSSAAGGRSCLPPLFSSLYQEWPLVRIHLPRVAGDCRRQQAEFSKFGERKDVTIPAEMHIVEEHFGPSVLASRMYGIQHYTAKSGIAEPRNIHPNCDREAQTDAIRRTDVHERKQSGSSGFEIPRCYVFSVSKALCLLLSNFLLSCLM